MHVPIEYFNCAKGTSSHDCVRKGHLSGQWVKTGHRDVNGVGYSVEIPESAKTQLPEVGSDITLYTHYHCRENEVKLYGFASQDDLTVFETALVVKGVGPSLALNIVSKLSPSDFQRAIRDGDHATLMRVPRLNKELAQLIIMKLKNTVRKIHFDAKVDDAGSQGHTEAGVKV